MSQAIICFKKRCYRQVNQSNVQTSKYEELIYLINDMNENDLVNYLTNQSKDHIVVICEKSKDGYFWNEEQKLWQYFPFGCMASSLCHHWCLFIERCLEILNDKLENQGLDKIDVMLINGKIQTFDKFQSKISFYSAMKSMYRKVFAQLVNKEFVQTLNKSPNHLPIQNQQVINLQTKQVRPRTKQDLFTYECPVTFIEKENEQTYEVAETYIKGLCCGNEEYANYLKKLIGYCLTGETSDRSFYIVHGPAKNGKSALFNILHKILGCLHFSTIFEFDFFKYYKNNGKRLVGKSLMQARLAVHYEIDKIKLGLINSLVNGDNMVTKLDNKKKYTFSPFCKYFLIVNSKPTIVKDKQNNQNNQNNNVVKYLPFIARFENTSANRLYIEQLQTTHLNVLFSYFVEGASEWYQDKQLVVPAFCENFE
jgi:phage/plasmid-associated DNA primase